MDTKTAEELLIEATLLLKAGATKECVDKLERVVSGLNAEITIETIMEMANKMNAHNVPPEHRSISVTPQQYESLKRDANVLSYINNHTGNLDQIAGIDINVVP